MSPELKIMAVAGTELHGYCPGDAAAPAPPDPLGRVWQACLYAPGVRPCGRRMSAAVTKRSSVLPSCKATRKSNTAALPELTADGRTTTASSRSGSRRASEVRFYLRCVKNAHKKHDCTYRKN